MLILPVPDSLLGTKAMNFPSLARYSGSNPSISQAAFTAGLTGIFDSSSQIETWLWPAISFSVVANPPLVGSRKTCVCGAAFNNFPPENSMVQRRT